MSSKLDSVAQERRPRHFSRHGERPDYNDGLIKADKKGIESLIERCVSADRATVGQLMQAKTDITLVKEGRMQV